MFAKELVWLFCTFVFFNEIDQLNGALAVCGVSTTMQTCLNCVRVSTSCPNPALGWQTNMVNGTECKVLCQQTPSCDEALYYGSFKECNMFGCSSLAEIDTDYDVVTYRRACHSDCPVFEARRYENLYSIDSSCLMTDDVATSDNNCFAQCMDTVHCRAAVFYPDDTSCDLYNCTTTTSTMDTVETWIKECRDPTTPPVVQTCHNCEAGPKCTSPMFDKTGLTSYDDCSAECSAFDDCSMYTYDRDSEQCSFHFCNQVSFNASTASVAFRRTYNTDCPNYDIIRVPGALGIFSSATKIAQYTDVNSEQTCLERCLETVGCVAATLHTTSNYCFAHNVQDFSLNSASVFYKRICHADCVPIIQTCLNCNYSSVCQNSFNSFSVKLTSECNDACTADDRCKSAVYEPSSSLCSLYQCPRMSYSHFNLDFNLNTYSTNTVFRKSCRTDCPVYRLQSKGLTKGTCPTIDEVVGDIDMDYCVHKCLDMTDCSAVTYRANDVLCLYHNCTNQQTNISLSDHMFIWLECEQAASACTTTMQTCINCDSGIECQQAFQQLTGVTNGANCNTECSNNDNCTTGILRFEDEICELSECSKVEYSVSAKAFRKSCSTACPVYALHKRYNYLPADTIVTYNGIWSYQECLAGCLDNDYCRSIVYWTDHQMCQHQNSTLGTHNALVNTVFVERDCSAGCDKTFTQTCIRCKPASHCPSALREVTEISLVQDCLQSTYWTPATSVHYKPSASSCTYYDCGGVQPWDTVAPEKIVRKSCINECPDIELDYLLSTYGNCDGVVEKLPDIEIDASFCIEHCLDTSTCRGINYNLVTKECYYLTSTCTAPTTNQPDWRYTFITCINTTANSIQTCQNCVHDGCQSHFENVTVTSSIDCRARCEASTDCKASSYSITTGTCLLNQCNTISQGSAGSYLFRKTNNADCMKYELYQNTGYAGNCTVMQEIDKIYFYQHCMDICLDTPGCRGITHTSGFLVGICYLHNITCSVLVATANSVYIIKDCLEECATPITQTCINCKADDICPSPSVQSLTNVTMPLNIDTTTIQTDEDVKQIWYSVSNTQYYHLNCPNVLRSDGDHSMVYRKSCSTDCPKYELFEMPGYRGTCNEIGYLSGGVTYATCLSKCLDLDQCRGVTFDNSTSLTRCIFHDCDNYTMESGYDFVRRRCIEDCVTPTTQECVGCSPYDGCLYYNNQTKVTLESTCESLNDGYQTMMSYNRVDEECKLLQCPYVKQDLYNLVHRQSCNTDCTRFEVFNVLQVTGTCDVIGEDRGERVTMAQCAARCLDMPSCRATTYYADGGFCEYHNCTGYAFSNTNSPTFLYLRCLDSDPPRVNDQICVGCKQSNYCQWYKHYDPFKTSKDCQDLFDADANKYTYYYDFDTRACFYMDCHWVMQDYDYMNSVMFRRSPSTDCPIYRLLTLTDKYGSCTILDLDMAVTVDYCVNRCLDMDTCRAISHNTDADSCEYHTCIDYGDTGSSTTFVMRECMSSTEYEPVKPYNQVIKDGRTDCGEAWDTTKVFPIMATENNIDASSDCDTTCVYCNAIIYSASAISCRQYECDLPAPNGEGNTMLRRTSNPECLNIHMVIMTSVAPACAPYHTEVGFKPTSACIGRCLDDPNCKAIGFLFGGQDKCTYYNCTDNLLPDTNTNYLTIKNCINDCATFTTQVCLNCKEGSICQPASAINLDTESNCWTDCYNVPACEGLSYNTSSSVCSEFACGRVQQLYDSMFYRKSCDTDCPLYEIYTIQGIGTCAIYGNMTEKWVSNPEVCYQRCLDTSGCRGVSYDGFKCEYHQCDCFDSSSSSSDIFMWRYCLNDVSERTILTNPANVTTYPYVCVNTTIASTSSTFIPTSTPPETTSDLPTSTPPETTSDPPTSSLPPSTSTPPESTTGSSSSSTLFPTSTPPESTTGSPLSSTLFPTSTPPDTSSSSPTSPTSPTVSSSSTTINNIYITPCICNSGAYDNMTQEEIIEEILSELFLDADSTSSHYRTLNSAKDDRQSSTAIGIAGVAIISSVSVAILILDLPTLFNAFRNITNVQGHLPKKTKPKSKKNKDRNKDNTNEPHTTHNEASK